MEVSQDIQPGVGEVECDQGNIWRREEKRTSAMRAIQANEAREVVGHHAADNGESEHEDNRFEGTGVHEAGDAAQKEYTDKERDTSRTRDPKSGRASREQLGLMGTAR